MRLRLHLRVLISLAVLARAQVPAPAGRIPEIHATAFSGDPIDLPQALRGHTAVLILGFSQSSRDPVTQWSRRLAADYRNSPTVLYYEMPVLADVPKFLRGMVIGKIKKDVPPRAQPRFVPILDHESEWKVAVGYSSQDGPQKGREDDAWLLVVDSSGVIHSRLAVGPPTDQTYADLVRRLASIKP